MMLLPALDNVLEYQNPSVLACFKQNHPSDAALNFLPVMHAEMRSIDNMWHAFILLPHDYQDFCQHYFGRFLHHEPNMRQQLDYSEADFIASLQLFLHYLADVLGEEVLRSWFEGHLADAV